MVSEFIEPLRSPRRDLGGKIDRWGEKRTLFCKILQKMIARSRSYFFILKAVCFRFSNQKQNRHKDDIFSVSLWGLPKMLIFKMASRCRHCALNVFSPHAPPSGATRDNQTDERARTRCCIEKLGGKIVLPRTNKIVRSQTGIKKNLFRPVQPLTEKFQLSPLFSFVA